MLRQGQLHLTTRHPLPAALLGVPQAVGEAALVPQGDLQQCTACSHGEAWQADLGQPHLNQAWLAVLTYSVNYRTYECNQGQQKGCSMS